MSDLCEIRGISVNCVICGDRHFLNIPVDDCTEERDAELRKFYDTYKCPRCNHSL